MLTRSAPAHPPSTRSAEPERGSPRRKWPGRVDEMVVVAKGQRRQRHHDHGPEVAAHQRRAVRKDGGPTDHGEHDGPGGLAQRPHERVHAEGGVERTRTAAATRVCSPRTPMRWPRPMTGVPHEQRSERARPPEQPDPAQDHEQSAGHEVLERVPAVDPPTDRNRQHQRHDGEAGGDQAHQARAHPELESLVCRRRADDVGAELEGQRVCEDPPPGGRQRGGGPVSLSRSPGAAGRASGSSSARAASGSSSARAASWRISARVGRRRRKCPPTSTAARVR